jgi:hypothetical protein
MRAFAGVAFELNQSVLAGARKIDGRTGLLANVTLGGRGNSSAGAIDQGQGGRRRFLYGFSMILRRIPL